MNDLINHKVADSLGWTHFSNGIGIPPRASDSHLHKSLHHKEFAPDWNGNISEISEVVRNLSFNQTETSVSQADKFLVKLRCIVIRDEKKKKKSDRMPPKFALQVATSQQLTEAYLRTVYPLHELNHLIKYWQ